LRKWRSNIVGNSYSKMSWM